MAFTTKLDFSNNRQVKQDIETLTVLSGSKPRPVAWTFVN